MSNGYPPFAPYGGSGYVPRGGRRRSRTRRMRGGDPGYVPLGGEMGTKGDWTSGYVPITRGTGGNPSNRGTVGGRRRRKSRRRRTMRGGYRLDEAAGARHSYTLLGRMPPDNSGQR
jgi:hypothetical protein